MLAFLASLLSLLFAAGNRNALQGDSPQQAPVDDDIVFDDKIDPDPGGDDPLTGEDEPIEPPTGTEQDPVRDPPVAPVGPVEPDPVEPEPSEPAPVPPSSPTDGDTPLDPIARVTLDSDQQTIEGGRVRTFELEGDQEVSSVKILSMPDHGNVVVNPDSSIAVVMTGETYSGQISFDYEVTYADGTTQTSTAQLSVSEPLQAEGWGLGQSYMLEEDENGEIIVETGDNHRPFYISESDDALTIADIAALEGLGESDITTQWLIDHPEYGGSQEMALKTDVGVNLWIEVTGTKEPNSNWLLFEKGYTYSDLGRFVYRGAEGEDELHPMHITSWGEGERPILDSKLRIYQEDTNHIAFSDVTFSGGVSILQGNNMLFDDVKVTDEEMGVQNVNNLTIHDSELTEVAKEAPTLDEWHPHTDRSSALYTFKVNGLLMDNNLIHQNAWVPGYETDDEAQPPSMFSHGVYLGHTTSDLTATNNIFSQGASYGMMARGGGYIENNLFLDNNNAVNFLGGAKDGESFIGNFTFFADNVITSGAHKEAFQIGGLTQGVRNGGMLTTMLDNIVAHVADPNDPEDIEDKYWNSPAIKSTEEFFFNDTIIYAWDGQRLIQNGGESQDMNTEGLDEAVLDQTTIQLFAESLLGAEGGTIEALMDYVGSLAETEHDDSFQTDWIIDYFQNGFGIAPNGDESQTEHTFIPNTLADGVRWDNSINWDTQDVPDDGDSVDLNGNWVQFGDTVKVEDLDMDSGGKLSVNHGRLTVEEELTTGEKGADILIHGAGQFWTEGYSGEARLTLDIDGGRFVNTGDFDGTASLDISGGQALLGVDDATMVLGAESELRIDGSDSKVGFDGSEDGISVLQFSDDSVLSIIADAEGFSSIEEFRSGRFSEETPEVQSGVALDGTLKIDVSALTGEGTHTLIETDALSGVLDDIQVHGIDLGFDARFTVDYETDQVGLEYVEGGTGEVHFDTVGLASEGSDEAAELWAVLTDGFGVYTDEHMPELSAEDEPLPDLLYD
jgi:hypothetical protein